MATYDVVNRGSTRLRTRKRVENIFFTAMSLLLLATAFVGFARSYFLAGMFRAHLPNLLIHVHAVAFTTWIALLVVQATLIASDRYDLHRRLGLFGFGLACLMVVVGVMAATNAMTRIHSFHGIDLRTFYAVPMFDLLGFSSLIVCAFLWRHDPAAHKRFILLATIAIIDAAGGRAPLTSITRLPYLNDIFTQVYVIVIAAFDWLTLGKIHRVTLVGGLFAILVHWFAIPVGRTHAWIAFATWAMNAANFLQK